MCVSAMQGSCKFVLVHMCMGMLIHKSQITRKRAVKQQKQRLHTMCRAVLNVLRARSGLRPQLSRSVCS